MQLRLALKQKKSVCTAKSAQCTNACHALEIRCPNHILPPPNPQLIIWFCAFYYQLKEEGVASCELRVLNELEVHFRDFIAKLLTVYLRITYSV